MTEIAKPSPYRVTVHAIAWLAFLCALPLLLSGADVTTRRVGMAVPDWPTTFNENMVTYDMSNAPEGVRIEHRHRLFGMALGISTIVVVVWFLIRAPRSWMKVLAVIVLLAVITQGLLGGNRVLRNSTLIASIHGTSAQVVLALLTTLVVMTSRSWLEPVKWTVPSWQRSACLIAPLVVMIQAALGARLRHFSTGLEWHASGAVVVGLFLVSLSLSLIRRGSLVSPLARVARACFFIVLLQIGLGLTAWWLLQPFDGIPRPLNLGQIVLKNAHFVNGALLLAASTALALRSFRHLEAMPRHSRPVESLVGNLNPAEAIR